ncbi:magnesium transporter [Haloferula sp.]|uniref:magnesium transporter n=1 Tax=Haloferula sp. TaxID=2497595 RepID=UPI003C77B9E5
MHMDEVIEDETLKVEVLETLRRAVVEKDGTVALAALKTIDWDDQRWAVSRLSADEVETLIRILGAEDAAKLLSHLAEAQAVEVLEELESSEAAAILDFMSLEESGDLLRELDEVDAEEIIAGIADEETRTSLEKHVAYPDGSAGSLMHGGAVTFPVSATVREVLTELGEHAVEYSDRDVQYLYVVEADAKLVGVLRLRDLVLSTRGRPISELMIPDPLSVKDSTGLPELVELFEQKKYFGLPVVDDNGQLLGVIPKDAVSRESAEEQADMFLQASGIVNGEEIRSMPLLERCGKRLAWLGPNIVLNLMAASVIAANEATLREVIALAVFLPIVSDMSGCSGNQAVAVSIRELTLGLLRQTDYWRIVLKEGAVGMINGFVLGCVLGSIAALWKGNIMLGVVVASALMLNTMLSVLLGGMVPLFLKRMKVDPALASGPILTTCTDMCGFFLVLTFASAALSQLAGV